MNNPWSLPPIEVDGEQEYEMENVLNSRIFNRQLQYLVHWHGYDVWHAPNFLMNPNVGPIVKF